MDCGDGTLWLLMRAGIAPRTVRHLIFTHLHADHTLGYMPFVAGAADIVSECRGEFAGEIIVGEDLLNVV